MSSTRDGGNTIALRREVRISLPKPAARPKLDGAMQDSSTLGLWKIEKADIMVFSDRTFAARVRW